MDVNNNLDKYRKIVIGLNTKTRGPDTKCQNKFISAS